MEGDESLTPPSEERDPNEPWFADFADSLCPYYMSIGVPIHEYWRGDYSQFPHYVEAYRLKQEHENYLAWLQGAYVYDAICAVSPVLHAFAKKGTKAQPYHKKPYSMQGEEENDVSEDKQPVNPALAKFTELATRWNRQFDEKGGGQNADD